MKISVIIPTYNEEKVITKCIKSLQDQTFKDFEIIVVDDGSTDKTFEVLSQLKIINLKLQILRQQHKGPGAARNLGVQHASGEILVFVDADMTFDKSFLKNLVVSVISGESKGTFSKYEYVSNWDNVWARCWNINQGWQEKRRHPENYPNAQPVFRAILKKEFNKVGGFDPTRGYMDDWSLSEKLGYEASAAHGAIFYHENPETLREVFTQAKWIGKRPYKLGIIGSVIALIRVSFPISLIIGCFKTIVTKTPAFVIFKIVYDFGILVGIFQQLIIGKRIK